MRPGGGYIYTSSRRSPRKNALLTSTCLRIQSLEATTTSRRHNVFNFATREKVFMKSRPSNYVYPLATKHALYQSIDLSDLCFIL